MWNAADRFSDKITFVDSTNKEYFWNLSKRKNFNLFILTNNCVEFYRLNENISLLTES